MQECTDCGIDKVLICESKERNRMHALHATVRKYTSVTREVPGQKATKSVEPVRVMQTLAQVVEEIRETCRISRSGGPSVPGESKFMAIGL